MDNSCYLGSQQVNMQGRQAMSILEPFLDYFATYSSIRNQKDVSFPPKKKKKVYIALGGLHNAHVRRCVRVAFFAKFCKQNLHKDRMTITLHECRQ